MTFQSWFLLLGTGYVGLKVTLSSLHNFILVLLCWLREKEASGPNSLCLDFSSYDVGDLLESIILMHLL